MSATARFRRIVCVVTAIAAAGVGAAAPFSGAAAAPVAVSAPAPGYGDGGQGTFRPVPAFRATSAPVTITAHQTVAVPVRVPGHGLPDGSDYAVAVNVTVASATALSYLSVFRHGAPRPLSSTLNFSGIAAASMIVPMSADGTIDVYNDEGTAQVLVDVQGYYPTGVTYTPIAPKRFLDTRVGESTDDGQMARTGAVVGGRSLPVPVAGRLGVPASGVAGVYATVTAVYPTQETYISAYPSGAPRPNASTLNPRAGQILANLAYIPLGADGKVALYNNAGAANLILDVVGYVSTAATSFHSFAPKRFLDTRAGEATFDAVSQGQGALGSATRLRVPVAGRAGIPRSASSVVVNLTGLQHGGLGSYLTLGTTQTGGTPPVSNVNPGPQAVAANLAIAALDVNGDLVVYNNQQTVDVIIDVVGWSDAVVRPGVQLVGRTPAGGYPNGGTSMARLSADGSTVVLLTSATDLAGGARGLVSVDRATGAARLLTTSQPLGFESFSTSADGSVVAYTTSQPPGGGAATDYARLYIWSRSTGTWTAVPMPADGLQFEYPTVSGDGRYVAFTLDVSATSDPFVYVYDRQTGSTTPLVTDATGAPVTSYETRLSPDGRYAAFLSWMSTFTPGAPTSGKLGVFLLDRTTKAVTTVYADTTAGSAGDLYSMAADGSELTYNRWGSAGTMLWKRSSGTSTALTTTYSADARLSADGRYACFTDTGLDGQVYRLDLTTGERRLVSVTKYGTGVLPTPQTAGTECELSGDGRLAMFLSGSSQFLPGNPSGLGGAYVNDVGAP